jgi:hypothetical protein
MNMSEQSFCRNMEQIGTRIALCIENRLQLSALLQLYPAIDIAVWLDSNDLNATVFPLYRSVP